MSGSGAREGFASFGDWTTWYRVVGDLRARPPLICLHGGPGSSHHYFAPVEELARRGRAVVLYDQVGCGHSSRPSLDELDVSVFVAELANLRARLELDEAFVLGTSWGGMLAMEYALTQPAGLLGLVLNSTLASAVSWADEAARLRDEMPEEHRRALQTQAENDPAYREAERAFSARHICRVGERREIKLMSAARSQEVYRAMWGPNEWTMTGKLGGWDVRDRLHEIQVPTLLTAGRYDLCTPLILNQLQEGFPDAPTVVFENSSHMPYLEEPDEFLRVLEEFLNRYDPPVNR
ncbi:MAG: proline iminopeptidase-family hydrolase [Actinomycetota bacterium]|nr:proline iminopeptidase-family hydrolase [Actinomycetota bacterium]